MTKFSVVIRNNSLSNPNHHIWLNRGNYFCNLMVSDGLRLYRVRKSLKTSDVIIARKRRDKLIDSLKNETGAIDS